MIDVSVKGGGAETDAMKRLSLYRISLVKKVAKSADNTVLFESVALGVNDGITVEM